jgi:hypothetical protein
MANSVRFEGWCPFMACLETVPHTHEVCGTCGAVRHGNPFGCDECLSWLRADNAEMTAELASLRTI